MKNNDEIAENTVHSVDLPASQYSPNNPPWGSLTAFLVWLLSIFLIIAVPSIALVAYLAANGIQLSDSGAMSSFILSNPNAILVNILAIIPAHIITLIAAWLVVTNVGRYSFTEVLGWKLNGFGYLYMFAIVFGFLIAGGVLNYFIPSGETDLMKILNSSRSAALAVAFMATFTAPIVEEVIYRGIMYSAFQKSFGPAAAVVLVTLCFALVHVPQYYESVPTILMIFSLSLTLTLIRVKTNSLLPCIILHTIFNGIQSALIIAQPYLPAAEEAKTAAAALI